MCTNIIDLVKHVLFFSTTSISSTFSAYVLLPYTIALLYISIIHAKLLNSLLILILLTVMTLTSNSFIAVFLCNHYKTSLSAEVIAS
uniref:Uncharacterized protein n=1 Tax=Octopus bimaculoides TaxID=37653 RepID=A0A0L8I1Z6_OCTBM